MTSAIESIRQVRATQDERKQPLAIILAGHNGSGKSTFWRRNLADELQMPLVNADRMMLAILPEQASDGALPPWAAGLRDTDQSGLTITRARIGRRAWLSDVAAAETHYRRSRTCSRSPKLDVRSVQ